VADRLGIPEEERSYMVSRASALAERLSEHAANGEVLGVVTVVVLDNKVSLPHVRWDYEYVPHPLVKARLLASTAGVVKELAQNAEQKVRNNLPPTPIKESSDA